MNGFDPIPMLEEAFAPLSEKYGPSPEDRGRVAGKLRARLGAPLPGPLAAKSEWHCRSFLSRRWALLGAGVIALAAGGFTLVESSRPSPLPSPEASVKIGVASPAATPTSLKTARPIETSTPSAQTATMPSVRVDALPSAGDAPAVAPANAPPSFARAISTDDALARETRLWGRANHALNDGDLPEALRLLDEHARVFPHGLLADERNVERILVLCRMGRQDDAVRDAEAFLSAHRKSPLRGRIESTCAAPSEEKQ